jgi:hypothetical protein
MLCAFVVGLSGEGPASADTDLAGNDALGTRPGGSCIRQSRAKPSRQRVSLNYIFIGSSTNLRLSAFIGYKVDTYD